MKKHSMSIGLALALALVLAILVTTRLRSHAPAETSQATTAEQVRPFSALPPNETQLVSSPSKPDDRVPVVPPDGSTSLPDQAVADPFSPKAHIEARISQLQRFHDRLLSATEPSERFDVAYTLAQLGVLAELDCSGEYEDTHGKAALIPVYREGELHAINGHHKYDLLDTSRFPAFAEMDRLKHQPLEKGGLKSADQQFLTLTDEQSKEVEFAYQDALSKLSAVR